jgi:membrane-associated HD superfamily phosphohydrolase
MLDFLKRGRLIKRGLASRKTRRRRPRSELARNLEYAPYAKFLIFAAFAGGLAFLVFSGQQPEPTKNFVIALLVLATAITQLWINQPKSFAQSSRILLIFGVILVQLAVTKGLLVICNSGDYWFLKPEMGGLITPYAFAPLTLSVLLGRHHGLYAAFFVSLWSSVLFGPIDAPLLVTSLISGFTAVSLTLQVRRRSKLIRAGIGVGLAIWLLSLTFGLIGPITLFSSVANDWGMIGLHRQGNLDSYSGWRRAADARTSISNHNRHFLVGSFRSQPSVVAPYDNRGTGHLSSQFGRSQSR